MGVIADKRLRLIRGLVKTLPEQPLRSLEAALSVTNDAALIEVRNLITAELELRLAKAVVFAPYLDLFEVRRDDLNSVIFPKWLLNNLWNALETYEPELYQQSRYALRGLRPEDPTPVVFFRLITSAAEILRTHADEIVPKSATKDDYAEVAEFAHYLDLHRIIRAAMAKLPEWMGRMDAEKAASLRVLFKDASSVSEAGGIRFMEVLFSQLDDGASIIKFVATVSDRANDRFLAESELAEFGERILELVEERLEAFKQFMSAKTPQQAQDSSRHISACLGLLQNIEHFVELSRDGPWSKRVAAAKKTIATLIEDRLKSVEKIVDAALPVKTVRGRPIARLDRLPSPEAVEKAEKHLLFVKDVRNSATNGGYATLYAKVAQSIEVTLDGFFEDLLLTVNSGDEFDADDMMCFFEAVITLIGAFKGDEAASLARRRVASSNIVRVSKNVA